MHRRTLNLGIVAHVDAGKTTLTERLLYAAGVIDEIGSVDAGTTRTDSLELERRRGITIRSAVVSFPIDDISVNLLDTPGHPDFIAEVERVLSILDGAVLVISAVEGVQPQTRILIRALQRLRIPTLLFVNKIDRRGAGYDRVLEAIRVRLGAAIVAMGPVDRIGTPTAQFTSWGPEDAGFRSRLAELLAERDDALLAAYIQDEAALPYHRLREQLAAQARQALVHPVFFGSAVTGAGVAALMAGLAELLPAAAGDASAPVAGRVFKIERGPAGERVAYVRMFTGTVRTRDRLPTGRGRDQRVTAVNVFDRGAWVRRESVSAGEIGKLWGLPQIQVGDPIGGTDAAAGQHHFPPPALAAAVAPRRPEQGASLLAALTQLAEQDPLINVRRDGAGGEIRVSLYGEVQKQVIQATLASDYGIEANFRESSTVCVERPAGTGEAVEVLFAESNPFLATVGLRVVPAPPGSGVEFRLQVDFRSVPLFVYKSLETFGEAMEQYLRAALRVGRYGWEVTDCVVSLVECGYSSPDGPPATRGPLSTAADFRKLTPLVLGRALERAGTVVCEPVLRVHLEIPAGSVGAVLAELARLDAAVRGQSTQRRLATVAASLPAARIPDLQRQLPRLTSGEGVLESAFDGYRPVRRTRLR